MVGLRTLRLHGSHLEFCEECGVPVLGGYKRQSFRLHPVSKTDACLGSYAVPCAWNCVAGAFGRDEDVVNQLCGAQYLPLNPCAAPVAGVGLRGSLLPAP